MIPAPPFVGREEELNALRDVYASSKSEFYPVYGRRRVGKTQLILKLGRSRPCVYYLGKEGPEDIQIREFMHAAAAALDQPVLAAAAEGMRDWKSALTTAMSLRPKGRKPFSHWTSSSGSPAHRPCFPASFRSFGTRLLRLCFERLCREALADIYSSEKLTAAFEVGEYWGKDVQIDVVGRPADGRTDIGECKWGTVRSLKRLASDLREKITAYPNPENHTVQPRIFLTKKPARAALPEGFLCHTIEDFYTVANP